MHFATHRVQDHWLVPHACQNQRQLTFQPFSFGSQSLEMALSPKMFFSIFLSVKTKHQKWFLLLRSQILDENRHIHWPVFATIHKVQSVHGFSEFGHMQGHVHCDTAVPFSKWPDLHDIDQKRDEPNPLSLSGLSLCSVQALPMKTTQKEF